MILWTIMPPEMVLDGFDAFSAVEEIQLDGKTVLVEKYSPNQARIVRLISSSPDDYLRPEFQPGTILTYRPVAE